MSGGAFSFQWSALCKKLQRTSQSHHSKRLCDSFFWDFAWFSFTRIAAILLFLALSMILAIPNTHTVHHSNLPNFKEIGKTTLWPTALKEPNESHYGRSSYNLHTSQAISKPEDGYNQPPGFQIGQKIIPLLTYSTVHLGKIFWSPCC